MTRFFRILLLALCFLAATARAGENTPLHDAAAAGNKAKVEALLSQGADIHARVLCSGALPLDYAMANGRKDVVELLRAKGAMQIAYARAASEKWGDECAAVGDYRGAFDQYRSVWEMNLRYARFLEEKEGHFDPKFQETLERLLKKLAGSVEKLNPPPAMPESAVFAAQKGISFFKLAKDVRDFKAAAKQFEVAQGAAPWVGDYHYNLAKSQKLAGQLASALRTLRLAAILAKDKQESRDILVLRAEIEAMSEIENRR